MRRLLSLLRVLLGEEPLARGADPAAGRRGTGAEARSFLCPAGLGACPRPLEAQDLSVGLYTK